VAGKMRQARKEENVQRTKNKEQKQNTSHTKNHVGKRGKKQVATWAGVRLNKYHRFFFLCFPFFPFFLTNQSQRAGIQERKLLKRGIKKNGFL